MIGFESFKMRTGSLATCICHQIHFNIFLYTYHFNISSYQWFPFLICSSLLTVQPRITSEPSDIVLNERTSSALRCTSYGYPQPVIQWLHGGVQLPAMQSTTSITTAGNDTVPASYTSTLTVSNIRYGDRGQYTCVSRVDKTGFADSSHVQGSVSASATIKVYSKFYFKVLHIISTKQKINVS